jgi:hypothetical protein
MESRYGLSFTFLSSSSAFSEKIFALISGVSVRFLKNELFYEKITPAAFFVRKLNQAESSLTLMNHHI